jgi:uncharacterized membrane protein
MTTVHEWTTVNSSWNNAGIGMGGFLDGIAFHQIFQIHNMLSASVPTDTLINIEINMVWDGLFHALTWLMTALGIAGSMGGRKTP